MKTLSNCQKIDTIIYCYQYTRYLERHQLVSLLIGQVPSSAYLITDKDQENSFTPVHYAAMSGQAKVTKQLTISAIVITLSIAYMNPVRISDSRASYCSLKNKG